MIECHGSITLIASSARIATAALGVRYPQAHRQLQSALCYARWPEMAAPSMPAAGVAGGGDRAQPRTEASGLGQLAMGPAFLAALVPRVPATRSQSASLRLPRTAAAAAVRTRVG
jgi:hypothetical protein